MARLEFPGSAAVREWRRLRVLNRLAARLAEPLSARELCRLTCRFLAKEFGFFNIGVFTLDAGAARLTLEHCAGAYSSFARPKKYQQPVSRGIIGRVVRTGRRLMVPDTRRFPGFFQLRGMNIRSELAVPIRADGRLVGVLNVDSDQVNAFGPEDVALFETVAEQLATALERARLIAALEAELRERHRVTESLREAEKELKRVTSSIPDYLWSVELDQKGHDVRRYFSPVIETITGRPPGFYMSGIHRWLSTVHPDDIEQIKKSSARVRAGRLSRWEEQYRIVRPDGSVRWLLNRVVIRRRPNGHRRIDGVVSDVTKRVEAEQTLKAAEAELRGITHSISDCLWRVELDRQGRDVRRYFSPVIQDITGRPPKFFEPGTHRMMSIMHPDDRAGIAVVGKKFKSGRVRDIDIEYRIIHTDGSIRHVRSRGTVRREANGHLRMDGVLSDITARHEVEAALHERDRRFWAFLQNAPVAAWMKDDKLHYVVANRSSLVGASCTPPQVLGRSDYDLWPRQVAKRFRDNDRIVLRTGRFLVTTEHNQTAAGKRVVHWVHKFPFTDSTGRRYVGGMAVDITEREQIAQVLRELPGRIIAAQEAERRRIAGELHDSVSQVLSAAKFRIQAAESALPADSTAAENLRRARELAAQAMREVGRITHNLRPGELDDLGFLTAVHSLLDEFRNRTGLRVDFTAQRWPAVLPPDLSLTFYRLLQEGLNNIEKHAAARRVSLRLTRSGRHLQLRLADDGRGFDPRRPPGRANRRSGLGLLHMRERAAALDGVLRIESGRQAGTRVHASLPLPPNQPGPTGVR